ncbi:MAG: PAS domain-containing protein [Proteobacteria bacterium]|nr:PAS domain-containing protein [Pseudomonadota bacterium]
MQALGLVLDDRRDGFDEICARKTSAIHRDTRHLMEVWRQLDETGGFIVGIHIPSRRLANLLNGISLYEPIDGGRDFRVRLAGSAVLRRFGRDVAHLRLSEVFEKEHLAFHRSGMRQVYRSGTPFLYRAEKQWQGQRHALFEVVCLRVYSPDCRDSWILSGQAGLPADFAESPETG